MGPWKRQWLIGSLLAWRCSVLSRGYEADLAWPLEKGLAHAWRNVGSPATPNLPHLSGYQKILHHHRVQEIQSCAKKRTAQKAKAAAVDQKTAASVRRPRSQHRGVAPAKGEGDGDSDPDPDRLAVPLVLDQQGLANLLLLSKKTVQNIASVAPHKLPKATYLPCSKAPRYLRDDVLAWLYSYRQAVEPPPRKVGRPRIATQRP